MPEGEAAVLELLGQAVDEQRVQAAVALGGVGPGGVEHAGARPGSGEARSTSSSRPRTCRSVPANACTAPAGAVVRGPPGGDPRARRRTGQAPQRGARAVQTTAPSSISATDASAAPRVVGRQEGVDVGQVGPARAGPASPAPCTARATTRRTFVSTTGLRRP